MAEEFDIVHIGIHPYVSGPVQHESGVSYTYEDQARYVNARNVRLRHPGRNQVLLVEEEEIRSTTENFLGPDWGGLIWSTGPSDPTPLNIGWNELSLKIRRDLPARQYNVWGAELFLLKDTPTWGCLNYAYKKLDLPNKTIDIESCWLRPIDLKLFAKLLFHRQVSPVSVARALSRPRIPEIKHLLETRYRPLSR